MFQLPKKLSRGVSSIQAMRIIKMAPESAKTILSGPTGKESENFKLSGSKIYLNRNGECM